MARRTRNSGTATEERGDLLTETAAEKTEKKGSPAKSNRSGWDAFKKAREETRSGDYIHGRDDTWKPDEEETLVKFLDDEPFIVYFDTWVPAKNRGYSTPGPDNPLAELLDLKPRPLALFNILIATPPEGDDDELSTTWEHKVLRASPMLAELVEKMANHKRFGPLTKYYWEMSATGTKKNYQPTMNVVKEDDLSEDWGMAPLEDVDSFERWGPDHVYLYDDASLMDEVADLVG